MGRQISAKRSRKLNEAVGARGTCGGRHGMGAEPAVRLYICTLCKL